MAINLKNSRDIARNGVKCLVYGQSGAGKTRLIPTVPDVIAISAEAGLLSIADAEIPVIEITNLAELGEAYEWLASSADAKIFESVYIDSISEVAEVLLESEKRRTKDPRAAYGETHESIMRLIRLFRDLPSRNVVMSAKLAQKQDEMGKLLYSPSMPGNQTAQALPYLFDEIFALRVERNGEQKVRAILTSDDGRWIAKDRSGKLDEWELPDDGSDLPSLGKIISKIKGENQ